MRSILNTLWFNQNSSLIGTSNFDEVQASMTLELHQCGIHLGELVDGYIEIEPSGGLLLFIAVSHF